ncbi:MAG: phenylacetate--CoA ligase family protein [Pseudomonadota bacterium]
MTDHYDSKETQDPEAREASLMASLAPYLQDVVTWAPSWAEHLAGVDLASIVSRADLSNIPVMRKSDLMAAQAEAPPFGGFARLPTRYGTRLFLSPGPVNEPQGSGPDPWRAARALHAAGFRAGDIVHNSFSYHLTPGAFILEEGARAMGCHVIPAGVGNTEQQVAAARAYGPSGYVGTPDFLKVLLDKAEEFGSPMTTFNKALVSGGALFPAMREAYGDRGIAVLQAYATADAGVIAYESDAMDGLIVNEGIIVEIVRPGSDMPVPDGDVGEVVVTVFSDTAPLIRFGTGDLSAFVDGHSPCGRTNRRIKGWMGRADQRTKVKGLFVDPKQVAAIVEAHPDVLKARLVVSRDGDADAMRLMVEAPEADGLSDAIAATLQTKTGLGGTVELVAQGTLPNDGKVIADERDYEAGS